MSAAIWIAAERRPRWWERWWKPWKKPVGRVNFDPQLPARFLGLVGTFADAPSFDRGREALEAAGFPANDLSYVCAEAPATFSTFCRNVVEWIGSARQPRAASRPKAVGFPARAAAIVQPLLTSGGGFVLVRTASRFAEACRIIEECGGCVGVPAAERELFPRGQRGGIVEHRAQKRENGAQFQHEDPGKSAAHQRQRPA